MTEASPALQESVHHPLFSPHYQPVAILLASNVFLVSAVAIFRSASFPETWMLPVILLAAMGTLLPVGIGSALMIIRRTRHAVFVAAVACGLTVFVVCQQLLNLQTALSNGLFAVSIAVAELTIGGLAHQLSNRNLFPHPTRLATTAFVLKLAIVGLLAAAFLPETRNPLGFLIPSVEAAGHEVEAAPES